MTGLAEVTAVERAALQQRPTLGAALRALERVPGLPDGFLGQVYGWAWWLVVVKGYRDRTTATRYVEAVHRWAEWVVTDDDGLARWESMRPTDWDRWQRRLYLERKLAASTRRTVIAGVRSFCAWRARVGLGPDTSDGLSYPKRPHKVPRKYTPAQLRKLMAAARQGERPEVIARNVALLMFLWSTGGRREETTALELSQLEITDGNRASVRFFGKGSKERVVWFEGPAVEAMVAWLEHRSRMVLHRSAVNRVWVTVAAKTAPCGPLSLEGLQDVVARVAKAAKLPDWGVHRFRITFATALYDAGHDIERVRVAMGHSSIETTRRYLALSRRQQGVRLPAMEQHAVLGTRPKGLPLWATKRQPGIPVPLTPFTPPPEDDDR